MNVNQEDEDNRIKSEDLNSQDENKEDDVDNDDEKSEQDDEQDSEDDNSKQEDQDNEEDQEDQEDQEDKEDQDEEQDQEEEEYEDDMIEIERQPPKTDQERGTLRLPNLVAIGTPLEQVHNKSIYDQKIQKAMQTYKNIEEDIKNKESQIMYAHKKKIYLSQNSLFIYDKNSVFRRKIVSLIESLLFDRIILVVIALNTFFLSFTSYDKRLDVQQTPSSIEVISQYLEFFFIFVFMVEFFLKIIAKGFVLEKHTYLRDGWNIIDFIVVISCLTSNFSDTLSGVRSFTIFRPLKFFRSISGLRVLIQTILDAVPNLSRVFVFLSFLILIFGILGMELFLGLTGNRCRLTQFPVDGVWKADPEYTSLCVLGDDSTCPIGTFCRNPSEIGLTQNDPKIIELNYGYTNFDSITSAAITMFQVITAQGWTKLIIIYSSTYNVLIVHMYFIVLILFGFFFVVNLILAIFCDSYVKQKILNQNQMIEEQKQIQNEIKQKKKQEKLKLKLEQMKNDNVEENAEENLKMKGPQKDEINKLNVVSNVVVVSEQSSEDSVAIRERELFQLAILPIAYTGRAAMQKRVEDKINAESNEKVDFFDQRLTVLHNDNITGQDHIKATNHNNRFQMVRQFVAKEVIQSRLFIFILNLFIIINTIALSLNRYPQPQYENDATQTINLFCTIFFIVEIIVKVFGLGFKSYFKQQSNIFDCFIVAISVVEKLINVGSSSLSSLQSLRALSLFKIGRQWKNLMKLLMSIYTSINQIIYFCILLMLFMFMVALLGMELFAYRVWVDLYSDAIDNNDITIQTRFNPRFNFNSFYNAMITVFTIINGDNWNVVAYDHMKSIGSWWPYLYFIFVIIIGNFMLLRLLLSILIFNFGQSSVNLKQKLQDNKKAFGFNNIMQALKSQVNVTDTKPVQSNKVIKKPIVEFQGDDQNCDAACFFQGKYDQSKFQDRRERQQNKLANRFFDQVEVQDLVDISCESDEPNEQEIKDESKNKQNMDEETLENKRVMDKLIQGNKARISLQNSIFKRDLEDGQNMEEKQKQEKIDIANEVLVGNSLYVFAPQNRFRRECYRIPRVKYIEIAISTMIILSSALIALDNPLSDKEDSIILGLDQFFTTMFLIEALMKMVSNGFLINGQHSYLKSTGNILDFIVIVLSALDLNTSKSNTLRKLKIVRFMRVLRPLRLINRNESLKLSIKAFTQTLPQVMNLMSVSIIFFYLFGIFGVNIFKGTFYNCHIRGSKAVDYLDMVYGQADCFDYGGDWVNQDMNFDNIFNAIISLFIVAKTDGWVRFMSMGSDARGVGLQPRQNSQKEMQMFYVIFMVIGAFFMFNLFAGVIVDGFQCQQQKLSGYLSLTLEQQQWMDIQCRIMDSRPTYMYTSPTKPFRKYFFRLMFKPMFDKAMSILLVVNLVLLSTQHNHQEQIFTILLELGTISLLLVFTIELIIKFIALGKTFFYDNFQIIFLFAISTRNIGILLNMVGFSTPSDGLFKIIGMIRMLILVKKIPSLKVMFGTVVSTVSIMGDVGILMGLVLFMFAFVGIMQFPYLKRDGTGLNDQFNFSSFTSSFFTLFKSFTGEEWNRIMGNAIRQVGPDFPCRSVTTTEDYMVYGLEGCGDYTSYIFFLSYQIIFTLLILNLFVSVILESFDITNKSLNQKVKLSDIEVFNEIWKIFDRKATGFIASNRFTYFMIMLPQPLGWKKTYMEHFDMNRLHAKFQIPSYNINDRKSVYLYSDVLKVLSYYAVQNTYQEDVKLEPSILIKSNYVLLAKRQLKVKDAFYASFTSREVIAAFIIHKRIGEIIMRRLEAEYNEQQAREEELMGNFMKDVEDKSDIQSKESADLQDNTENLSGNQTPNLKKALRDITPNQQEKENSFDSQDSANQ